MTKPSMSMKTRLNNPLDVLTGDTDLDGDTLFVQSINGTAITPGTPQVIAVTNGTVNVDALGNLTFTPTPGYVGAVNFDYVVADGNGGTDTGSVAITVDNVNDAPLADDEAINVDEDTANNPLDVLTGDTDLDGDTLFVQSINGTAITPGTPQVIAVTNGTVNVDALGNLTFTPTPGYVGAVNFDYVVADGNGGTDTGSVAITVDNVNDAPLADDDAINVDEDTANNPHSRRPDRRY